MAGYVARTGGQKKKVILAQREDELRHHLRHESAFETIERCSERVRSAQLGVIRVLLYETEPARAEDEQHEEFRANLMKRRENWQAISAQDIVRQYQSELWK